MWLPFAERHLALLAWYRRHGRKVIPLPNPKDDPLLKAVCHAIDTMVAVDGFDPILTAPSCNYQGWTGDAYQYIPVRGVSRWLMLCTLTGGEILLGRRFLNNRLSLYPEIA